MVPSMGCYVPPSFPCTLYRDDILYVCTPGQRRAAAVSLGWRDSIRVANVGRKMPGERKILALSTPL